jgi:signal transduction histidine kinase
MFALILSGIYLNLSERNTIASFRTRLFEQGEKVSKRFTEFVRNEEYSSGLTYLENLIENGLDETWSVSNPNAIIPMDDRMASIDLEDLLSSKEYQSVIERAFAGKKDATSTSYSEIHGCEIVIVGVPVKGSNGEICGAILITAEVDTQTNELASTKQLVFSAAVVALIISFILAIVFARQLSLPISRMRTTALELAAQKYETKTGINRKDEIGDLARTIDFLTDKLLENEKIRNNLEQMRLDFFANVSHELRTPITVVRAYTESLVDGVVTDEDSKHQYYEKMLGECKSMERLVGDLLTLSKMQNPDFVVEKEPVSLVQIFEDVVRVVKTLGDEKRIQIHLTYDKDICLMYGDYDRLRQMFLVICDNAIKFSKEESSINITIGSSDRLIVKIRDEGIGIAKEELSNIFDKFYKSNLRQNAKGSGLGLAIAKQIALKHDGTVEVISEVGVGTEFIFVFKGVTLEEIEQ